MAQMIPIYDLRDLRAGIDYLGVTERAVEAPAAPYAYFESQLILDVPNPDPDGAGSCNVYVDQISDFEPSYIQMYAAGSGGWNVTPSGLYYLDSNASFRFRVDTCVEFTFDAWLDMGDMLAPGTVEVRSGVVDTTFYGLKSQSGEIHESGRFGPGEYIVSGFTTLFTREESGQAPTYSVIWTCVPCAVRLIREHPDDATVGCGGTAVFHVVPEGAAAGSTYQWRRNFVPISNGGRVSGATSQTLVLTEACHADSGYYDVVLSDGTIVEPSRLARLQIVATPTAVEAEPATARELSIVAAGPHPFPGRASFRYTVSRPKRARITIHNAAGALVRTLVDGVVSGSGTLEWDGTNTAGSRAPAGVYFLRAETDTARESRKIVLLR